MSKKLFERVVKSGVFIERVSVPSRRNSTKHNFTRYEVCDYDGRLLGKGHDQQQALDQAWKSFQQDK